MLKNYFKTAWRSLIASKTFSLINISGLALGIASSLLIFLWVNDEISVDKFHAHGNRLFLMYETETVDGKMFSGYWTPGLLAQELKKKIPEVQYATDMFSHEGTNFEAGDKRLDRPARRAGRGCMRRRVSATCIRGRSGA
jgi:putative ABC transport system permease protein